MNHFKQSFAWWSFYRQGTDAHALLRAASQIGYRGVELIEQEFWGEVRELGMRVATILGHASLTDGLNKPSNHSRIVDEVAKNCELAKKNDIPCLIVFSGNRNGLPDDKGVEITAEGLNRCKKSAEATGVTLALELLNSKVDHKDYQCDHTAWGVEVIKKVHSPRVKLLYDIYHMQIMEGDIIRTIRENHQHFGHYHTAGNPGRHDLDNEQELHYPGIMRAIDATGYQGFVGQEFVPKADVVQTLKVAFDLCNV